MKNLLPFRNSSILLAFFLGLSFLFVSSTGNAQTVFQGQIVNVHDSLRTALDVNLGENKWDIFDFDFTTIRNHENQGGAEFNFMIGNKYNWTFSLNQKACN